MNQFKAFTYLVKRPRIVPTTLPDFIHYAACFCLLCIFRHVCIGCQQWMLQNRKDRSSLGTRLER